MISKEKILQAKILIVDDQRANTLLLANMLLRIGYKNIISTNDSCQAVDLYKKNKPDLLILDLHMPYLDGFGVMSQVKRIEKNVPVPILVISSDDNPKVKFSALESGAKDFLNKPYDPSEVAIRIYNLLETCILHTQRLYDTQIDVIHRLAKAVEYRDSETGMHVARMSYYSQCLASEMGLNKEQSHMILMASPLHDMGKIGIPDDILLKPGKLTSDEWTMMQTHTTIGAELLSGGDSEFLKMAMEIALTHHEKWDGSGYPNSLKGDKTSLIGRICGLADVFDALTSQRPYKKAWSVEDAVEEIKAMSGSHFCPELVENFLNVIPKIIQIKEKHADVD